MENSKYLIPLKSTVFLTPSPTDISIESPTTGNKCLSICNNNIFASETYEKLTIDTVDSMNKSNVINNIKHPGQAVKIITGQGGEHTVVKENEVRKCTEKKVLTTSKSCTDFEAVDAQCTVNKSSSHLKDSKSCDENLIKFIFTKHGIQIISDIETIV